MTEKNVRGLEYVVRTSSQASDGKQMCDWQLQR